ncbi:MAG: hypothetical protein ACRC18_06695 [Cetobacterium sp.]
MKTLNKEEYGYGIAKHIKQINIDGTLFDLYSCKYGIFVEIDGVNDSAWPVGRNVKEAVRWAYMYIEGV